MLSQKYRFHGHGSLRYLFKNGQTVRNHSLLLRYTKNARRPESRVAVVVGKKVSKSAVKRNRIRRRVFEVIRTHWGDIAPNYDMLFTVFTAEFITMTSAEVEQNVVSLLRSAHLYGHSPSESDKIN